MTRDRARAILTGALASREENGRIIMHPKMLDELKQAGLYVDGRLRIGALLELAECPHDQDHDSQPCPICGCQLTFDGVRAKWR